MQSAGDFVNHGYRSPRWVRPLVTAVALLAALGSSPVKADRVVVVPVSGEAPTETLETIEDHIADSIRALSHEALTEARAVDVDHAAVPETANEMRAIAELQNAAWAVIAVVRSNSEPAYWLTVRVAYAAESRVEELEVEVRRSREADRLREVLQAMLRPEGLSDDGLALAGEDIAGRESDQNASSAADAEAQRQAEEEARRQAEEEAQRQAEEEERAAQEAATAEERARLEQEAFENRDRYAVADGLNMIHAGVGFRPLVLTGAQGTGGILGTVEFRYGRGFEGLPGFELRAGADIVFGAAGAFSIFGGAAYLFSPFTTPLHIGASVEVGFFQTLSGQRSPAFMGRASAVVSYNLGGSWYIEGSLPEVMYLSAGGSALSLGISARLGVRF